MFKVDCRPLSLFSTHSVRNCWPLGRLMSTALRPVTSSTSTTPKEYTSAFSVIWPLWAYSGARYLAEEPHKYRHYSIIIKIKNMYFLSLEIYPNVPITRVSTPMSPSGCHLARPKSPTFGKEILKSDSKKL